jgi:hypothetical protein
MRNELFLAFAIPGRMGMGLLGAVGANMEEQRIVSRLKPILQQIVSFGITRPDRQLNYTVYPSINSYIDTPLPAPPRVKRYKHHIRNTHQ